MIRQENQQADHSDRPAVQLLIQGSVFLWFR